jgi:GMP synthase (glutamine-hydrolysing)
LLLVVDNGSIYTKQLTDFLSKKNISFEKFTPHILELNSLKKYESIILSGRRKNDKKINDVNSNIIIFSIKNDKKLLGICYGAEILALTLGGTIRKTESIQKGNETIEILKDNLIIKNSIDAFESHAFEISKLPNMLITIGKSDNCKYEIIQHKEKLIFGTQFHPEMSLDGNNLIENFCSL